MLWREGSWQGPVERLGPRYPAERGRSASTAADVHEEAAVGMGRDLRLTGPALSGAALEANASIVHLSAFHAFPEGRLAQD